MPKIAPKFVQTSPTPTPLPAPPARASPDPNHALFPKPPAASASAATATTTIVATEPTWLTGLALKAVHEHTFATQRAKKAADRAKGKASPRKSASGHSSSSSSQASSASPTHMAAMTSIWAEIWDARKMISAEDLEWPELPTPPPPSSLSQRGTTECALRPTQDREVPLSALVRPVKMRGAKTKESEFEFLPPVRNVIALDDADSNVPDEPWEYISSVSGDEEARKVFSYAEIVSKSA